MALIPHRKGLGDGCGGTLLNLLLPPQCPGCDSLVNAVGQLCPACFNMTDFISEPNCDCCGVPFSSEVTQCKRLLCPGCRTEVPLYRRARGAVRYGALSRRLILPFKYADRSEIARSLARRMAWTGDALVCEADLLIPVPLHRRRLFFRRYNQAALLARVLSKLSNVPAIMDALLRQRATTSLDNRTAAERSEIMEGVIVINPWRSALVQGRKVLLIDDVMTSGATANTCSKALLAAGARYIDVVVAARVPDPRLT